MYLPPVSAACFAWIVDIVSVANANVVSTIDTAGPAIAAIFKVYLDS